MATALAKFYLELLKHYGQHTDEACNISLPDHFKCAENTVDSLIDSIYPNIHIPNLCDWYFSEHIILSTLNQQVNLLNQTILERFSMLKLSSCSLLFARF